VSDLYDWCLATKWNPFTPFRELRPQFAIDELEKPCNFRSGSNLQVLYDSEFLSEIGLSLAVSPLPPQWPLG
jgi:hypothetical protein